MVSGHACSAPAPSCSQWLLGGSRAGTILLLWQEWSFIQGLLTFFGPGVKRVGSSQRDFSLWRKGELRHQLIIASMTVSRLARGAGERFLLPARIAIGGILGKNKYGNYGKLG